MFFFCAPENKRECNMARRITLGSSKLMSIGDAFEEFHTHSTVKGLAAKTLKYYEENIGYFFRVISKDMLCSEIDIMVVEDYILNMREQMLSKTTIATRTRAVRAFLYFCMEREYIKKFKIKIPKEDEIIKQTYSEDEVKKLLKEPQKPTFSEYRNYVAVSLLLATGIRVTTAINIKIKDLDFHNNCIILKATKNKKQQIMPMSTTLKQTLVLYLRAWSPNQEDYLFCNIYGKQLTDSGFKHEIAKYNISRGVTKTSCHLYRHTFSKYYIIAGGDIFRLQKLLGHSSLDMVRKYVNMYGSDLNDGFDNLNMLDNVKSSRQRLKKK